MTFVNLEDKKKINFVYPLFDSQLCYQVMPYLFVSIDHFFKEILMTEGKIVPIYLFGIYVCN